jgi:hypothetical protein
MWGYNMNRSRFAGLAERLIERYGATAPGETEHPTQVNGEEIDASWTEAQPGRAQLYLDEEHWGKPSYFIRFPIAALDAPFSLANGSEVLRTDLGWRGVVRHIDVPTAGGGIFAKALVTIVPN